MGGHQPMRGRNNGNYSRGIPPSHISSGGSHNYYDQMSSNYSNQPHQYYHHHNSQNPPVPLNMNISYTNNNNNNNRQRLNSNRSNNNRNSKDDHSIRNEKRLTSATSSSSYELTTVSAGKLIIENKFIFIFCVYRKSTKITIITTFTKTFIVNR